MVGCDFKTALEHNSLGESPIPSEKLEGIHAGFQDPKRAPRTDSSVLAPDAVAGGVARALHLR